MYHNSLTERDIYYAAGMTLISLDVQIINDKQENYVNFDFTIISSSLPSDVTVGSPDQVTVIIIDNMAKSIASSYVIIFKVFTKII